MYPCTVFAGEYGIPLNMISIEVYNLKECSCNSRVVGSTKIDNIKKKTVKLGEEKSQTLDGASMV